MNSRRAAAAPQVAETERFLRLPDVERLTGYKKSAIYAMIAKGEFPSRRQIGPNRVVWMESEVRAWMAKRLVA